MRRIAGLLVVVGVVGLFTEAICAADPSAGEEESEEQQFLFMMEEAYVQDAPGAEAASEAGLYERLREGVAGSAIGTRAGNVAITVSIGVACGAGDDAMEAILTAADAALYEAKRRGRNCVAGVETEQETP